MTAVSPRCEMGGSKANYPHRHPRCANQATRRLVAGCKHEHEAVALFCDVCATITAHRTSIPCMDCYPDHDCDLTIVSDTAIVSDTTRTVSDT